MIKTIGYFIFAFVYYICRPLPVDEKRVFGIMTHDTGEDSNVGLVIKELNKLKKGYYYSYITKAETESVKGFKSILKLLSFFFLKPYSLARSKIILMDNVFLPMAYIRVKRNVKVVQLWHGTGTIKKFGQDANTGRLKKLERRANRNITHLIVNNKQTASLYAKVFGVETGKVYPVGLPKTDDILNRMWEVKRDGINVYKEIIYAKNDLTLDKKMILYAPTFRDYNLGSESVLDRVEELAGKLPKDYVLGLRLHPFVAGKAKGIDISSTCDLSGESMASLIMASDLLITDYSSVIFEYCITEKPMIFYAFDLDDYLSHGRGIYKDYENSVPGPVVRTADEAVDIIKEERYCVDTIRSFKNKNFPYLDGKSTNRIINLITE